MSQSSEEVAEVPQVPKIRVNFAPPEDLRLIPGVGAQLANAILLLRESMGNMDPTTLNVILRRPLGHKIHVLHNLDFSPNPAFPKTLNPPVLGSGVPLGPMGVGAESDKELERLKLIQQIDQMEKDLKSVPWSVPTRPLRRETGAHPVSRLTQPGQKTSRRTPSRAPFGGDPDESDSYASTAQTNDVSPTLKMAPKKVAASQEGLKSDISSKLAVSTPSQLTKTSMASSMAATYNFPTQTNMVP